MRCKDCDGKGIVKCTKCSGEGFDYGNHKCETCTGEGVVSCSVCSGKGKVKRFKWFKSS